MSMTRFSLEVGTQQRKSRGINLGSLQLQTSFFLLVTGMMPTPTVSTSFSSKLHGARKCSRLPVMERSSAWHKVGIQQIFVEWMDFALNCTFRGSSYGVIMTWAPWALTRSDSGIFSWALTSSTCPLPTPQLKPRAIHLPSCKRIVFILYTGLYVWNVFPSQTCLGLMNKGHWDPAWLFCQRITKPTPFELSKDIWDQRLFSILVSTHALPREQWWPRLMVSQQGTCLPQGPGPSLPPQSLCTPHHCL